MTSITNLTLALYSSQFLLRDIKGNAIRTYISPEDTVVLIGIRVVKRIKNISLHSSTT